jgi:hypothetical protein
VVRLQVNSWLIYRHFLALLVFVIFSGIGQVVLSDKFDGRIDLFRHSLTVQFLGHRLDGDWGLECVKLHIKLYMAPLTPFVIKSSTSDSWFIQVPVSNGQLQTDTVYLHLFLHRVGQQHVKGMLLGEERCADDDLFCLACWPTPTIRNPQAATGGKQSMYFSHWRGS